MAIQWFELSPGVDEDPNAPPGAVLPIEEDTGYQEPTDESVDTAVEGTGYQVPTDESLNAAIDTSFDQLRPGLKDSPLLGSLEWEDPSAGTYPSALSQTPVKSEGIEWKELRGKEAAEEDDYGWGIKNAFMRGLIRAGSLIDIAQGDVEEYAEGMKAMEKWEVSEADQKRLAELQESSGFWDAMGYYVQNPALAMQVVVESLPMSTAPLVGGATGMAVAGPIGAVAGAGLGSFGTEYLASIGDAVAEHGVDVTNPQELMAAFADDKFMATARAHAAKRGVGVGAFDALSMGIAGRLYKPIKALSGAAKKTGGAVGGLSEMLAQGTAGALGEGAGQVLSGEEINKVEMASEFIGELVPGVAEIAINKARGRDAAGNRPEPGPEPGEQGELPLKGAGTATVEDDVPDVVDTSIPETDVDAEGKPYIVEPEPEGKPAITEQPDLLEGQPSAPGIETTPTTETIAEAPTTPAAEVSPTEEVIAEPETVADTESPLISAKELKPKIDKQLKGTAEEQRPVRTAWRKLTDALKERYPDVELPTMSGRTNGTGFGKFFQKLQEEVDITQDLPDLKTYLETVTEGKPAEIIKSLERLTGSVIAEIPSITVGEGGPLLTQLRSTVNTFNETVKARAQKKGGGKARNVLTWANAIGELAAGVKAVVDDWANTSALEGLPADFNDTIASALKFADKAQYPRETRTPSGTKTRNLDGIGRKGLQAISDKLLTIADQVAEAIAATETGVSFDALDQSLAELDALLQGKPPKAEAAKKTSKAKKGDTKGKVKSTSAVTEPVTRAKTDRRTGKEESHPMERRKRPRRKLAGVKEMDVEETIPTPKEARAQAKKDLAAQVAENKKQLAKGKKELAAAEKTAKAKEATRVSKVREAQKAVKKGMDVATMLEPPKKPKAAPKAKAAKKTSKFKAGTEVQLKEDLGPWRLVMIPMKGKVQDIDAGQPFVSWYKTKKEAQAEAKVWTTGSGLQGEVAVDITKQTETALPTKGEQAKIKAAQHKKTRAKKAKAASKVRGAKPDEVFDPQGRGIVGKKAGGSETSGSLLETTGVEGETLAEGLESAGVSKAAADKLATIYRSVSPEQATAIQKAAWSFIEHKEKIRLAAEIAEAVGATPSGDVLNSIMEFANAIDTMQTDPNDSVRSDMIAQYVEEYGGTVEDAEAILEEMGQIENQDPNRVYSQADYDASPLHINLNRGDRILLAKAMDKGRAFFDNIVNEANFDNVFQALGRFFSGKLKQITPAKKVPIQQVLNQLRKVLPKNHRYAILVERLRQLNLTIPVSLHRSLYDVVPAGNAMGAYNPGYAIDESGREVYDISRAEVRVLYNPENVSDARFLHTLLHEIVHTASLHAYETDGTFAAHVNELYRQALIEFQADVIGNKAISEDLKARISQMHREDFTADMKTLLKELGDEGIKSYYGLANPLEFIAEAFTNPRFQTFLGGIEVKDTPALSRLGGFRTGWQGGLVSSLLHKFIWGIKKFLGYSARNSVLNEILYISDINFSSQQHLDLIAAEVRAGKPIGAVDLEGALMPAEETEVTPMTTKTNDIIDESLRSSEGLGGIFKTIKEASLKWPRTLNLGFSNRDVIERNHRKLFAAAAKKVFNTVTNPLTQYVKAKQAASVIARKYEKKAYAVLQRAQKLSNTARAKMFGLMRDVTLAQVWPDKPLNHPANKHLWSKPDKKTGRTYLKPKTAEMAKAARQRFVDFQKSDPQAAKIMMEMAALTKEIQKAKMDSAMGAMGASFDLNSTQVKALQAAKTIEEIDALFPVASEATLESLKPVKGDTDARKAAKAEALAKAKENIFVARAAKEILKGTSIQGPYFPLRRYGDYVVSTTSEDEGDPVVVFVSTRWQAQKLSDDLNATGRKTYVSTKIKSQAVSADLESVATEITSRLTGPDSGVMKSRLQTALIESLAENTAYASQLRRANVDGVAADDMGRAFEEYVHVSKYTIGDLTTSHEIQDSLRNLKKLQNAEELTIDERTIIGEVVGEISNQNKEDANDRDLSTVQRIVGAVGFFNFLGAPSYWALNATQTYTVTLPYLIAKWGVRGPAALARGQKTVLAAATAAIASNDKSYDGFVAQLPPAAQRIVKRLEDENVIQSTIAHEFGDILNPGTMTKLIENAGVVGRPIAIGAKMMEKVPEAVEHFNRISTALAAYNLSGDIVATVDAVQATQFNYDSANRARLLKALPLQAGGGARAVVTPIMMFKTYGIGVSRLLYGSMFDVVMKKEGKAEAAKLAGGLIISHTLFGGVAGGLMLAPLSMLLGIFNAAFREAGDEFDPEEAVEAALQDIGMDAAAVMARRGAPAALLGIDMSKSINLGNLLWMGNDRYDFADSGGVEQAIAGVLGPVAQYGITSAREGYRLVTGDNRGNWSDFLAAVVPLKVSRGIVKGTKYGSEGLHTDSDLQFLDADQISGWARIAMGMGFRSTEVGSAMDAYYEEQARDLRRNKRKSQLIEQLYRAKTSKEYGDVLDDVMSFNLSLERRKDWINRGDQARLRSLRRSRQRKYDREHPQ